VKSIYSITLFIAIPLIMSISTYCSGGPKMNLDSLPKLTVTSPAFEQDGIIPSRYTCDGKDISPAISWSGAPEGTKSFVLISDDPDAPMGTWVHWIVYNIPGNVTELTEAVESQEVLDDGIMQGVSSWKRIGYGGPCPPSGTHRYFFKVYALDCTLAIKPKDANKKEVLKAMKGHIIAYGELIGNYKRQ